MKRFAAAVLSALFLLALLPQPVIDASAYGTASFTGAEGGRGEEVEIRLRIQCEKGLKTLALSDFIFDDSAVTLVSGQWLLQGLLSDFNAARQNAVLAFAANTPVSGDVVKLVFRISDSAAPGDYPIRCSITAKEKSTSQELPVDITLVPGKVTVKAAPHAHDFSLLKHDETGHWYECANGCGEISGKAAHTYGEWTVTKEATETAEGEKTRKCTVCGYAQTESVPKPETGYNGPCAYAEVKECNNDTVIVGVYLRKCSDFTCMTLAIKYDPSIMTPETSSEGNLIMHMSGSLSDPQLGGVNVYGSALVPGELRCSVVFPDPYSSDDTLELATVRFARNDTDAERISLLAEMDNSASFDPEIRMPYDVPTIYDVASGTSEFDRLWWITLGDVDNDGRITAADARLALRRAVLLEDYPEDSEKFIRCDVDRDGKVTEKDMRLILRAAVELEDYRSW